VAVCICTYRRPEGLIRLLESLRGLRFEKVEEPGMRVIIVDNDPDESARTAVEEWKRGAAWPVEYAVEPRQNISLGRNHAIEIALESQPEWIAFIDDDEVARDGWLDEFLWASSVHSADAFFGPVYPSFSDDPPDWIVKGRFFDPFSFPGGTRLDFGLTGNALVSARLFSDPQIRFDPQFGTSGGEDIHLFTRLHLHGARLIWINEAAAEESIGPERTTLRFLLMRAFRIGNAQFYCDRALLPAPARYGRALRSALGRPALGLLLIGKGLLTGRLTIVAGLRSALQGFGTIAGVLGYRYREYASRDRTIGATTVAGQGISAGRIE
jgi:succinoglycan biosynthesis protein ExoM